MSDNTVEKLVEIIFVEKDKNIAAVPDSSIPACLLKNDFLHKFQYIMSLKEMIYKHEWHEIVTRYCQNMFYSPEMYLRGIIYTCLFESMRNESTFEGFVSACAVLKFVTHDVLLGIDLDFCDLNRHICMAMYDNFFRVDFRRRGGFAKFVQHILAHRYLTWTWKWEYIFLSRYPTMTVNPLFIEELKEMLEKEFKRHKSQLKEATLNSTSTIVAQRILPTISLDFPTLPCHPDLAMKRIAARKEKMEGKDKMTRMEKLARSFADLQMRLSSDSIKNRSRNGDNAPYENIIQSVIRYNRSKSSSNKTSDHPIQKESDEILNSLKDKMNSLMAIVDDAGRMSDLFFIQNF